MKYINLFIIGFLALTSAVANEQVTKKDCNSAVNPKKTFSFSFLTDLEEQGYCVIPDVLSTSETEILYERVWHEFIELAWPNCKLKDRSNWAESFPMHNKVGVFAGPAGQTQVMWDLRQDPRIVDIFAKIWDTHDLIVSMDGISLMCPPEIREGCIESWPHVDQTILRRQDNVAHNNNPPQDFVSESQLKSKPYTIQGQFLFEESIDGDGGFYCIPKSHQRFTEFAHQLETISAMEMPKHEKTKARNKFLNEFFESHKDELGNAYCKKHIVAPRGSLILWDSRTVHWNQHASKSRPYKDNPKVRMVGYVCYVPKSRLTNEGKILRKEAFTKGVTTGHNPAYPELKYTKDHIYRDFEQYLEDSSYKQPLIKLTPLGESLLGI